jgi:hypothetical protein
MTPLLIGKVPPPAPHKEQRRRGSPINRFLKILLIDLGAFSGRLRTSEYSTGPGPEDSPQTEQTAASTANVHHFFKAPKLMQTRLE